MKPYSSKPDTKGLAGCRRSKATPHRKRSLRVDKKAARRQAREKASEEWLDEIYGK